MPHKTLTDATNKKCFHPSHVSTDVKKAGITTATTATLITFRQTPFKKPSMDNPTILRKKAKRSNKQQIDTPRPTTNVDSGTNPIFKQR